MHQDDLKPWQHDHDFVVGHDQGERRTRWVIGLTFFMMLAEIAAGSVFGSMALLADGWHMASHAGALSITAFAYWYARRHRDDGSYAFGTGKVNALGGFSSALLLIVVAALMVIASIDRWMHPITIRFDEAIAVAVVGLIVNVVSALLLSGGGGHHHHDHGGHDVAHDEHGHHHHDHNLRAAYLHVLADALTSVLAIVALVCGRFFGWMWMDALMGIVGAALITRWGVGLVRATSRVLLDAAPPSSRLDAIRDAVEAVADTQVSDLHVWRLTDAQYAAVLSVVTHEPTPPAVYAELVKQQPGIAHVTVEVNLCGDDDRSAVA